METKEQKKFYVTVNGQKVEVSEEVYRAYVRPMNASDRKERREARCMVKGKRKGLVRCREDCFQCPYYLAGNRLQGGVLSLDVFAEDGHEEASDLDLERDVIENEEVEREKTALHRAVSMLNERQQYLIREIFFQGRSQEEVRTELGIGKAAFSESLHRALGALGKFLRKQ